ncbi:hypothetical protein C4573_03600 [Candidatus Woesearchaeota archaeon]|nr:MAG: hypothetical protein C4573_03600 [Candidatus Woesearchaeota archaeon]
MNLERLLIETGMGFVYGYAVGRMIDSSSGFRNEKALAEIDAALQLEKQDFLGRWSDNKKHLESKRKSYTRGDFLFPPFYIPPLFGIAAYEVVQFHNHKFLSAVITSGIATIATYFGIKTGNWHGRWSRHRRVLEEKDIKQLDTFIYRWQIRTMNDCSEAEMQKAMYEMQECGKFLVEKKKNPQLEKVVDARILEGIEYAALYTCIEQALESKSAVSVLPLNQHSYTNTILLIPDDNELTVLNIRSTGVDKIQDETMTATIGQHSVEQEFLPWKNDIHALITYAKKDAAVVLVTGTAPWHQRYMIGLKDAIRQYKSEVL